MAITGISTPNRIIGLSSGLDTETMVKNMLSAQQMKVDRAFRQNTKAEWKLEAYTELNKAVTSFRNDFLSTLGANSMVKNSAYNTFNVKMASNSAISVTATSSALAKNFSIASVRMAKADTATSGATNTRRTGAFSKPGALLQASVTGSKTGLSAAMTIQEAFGLETADEGISFSININGNTETFSAGGAQATLGIVPGDPVSENISLQAQLAAKGISMSFDADGRITLTGEPGMALSFSNISSSKAFTEQGVFGIDEGAEIDAAGVTGTKTGLSAEDTVSKAFGIGVEDTLAFNLSGVEASLTFAGTDTLSDIQSKLAEHGVTMSFTEDGAVKLQATGDPVSFTNGAGALTFNEVGVFGINTGKVEQHNPIGVTTTLADLGIAVPEGGATFSINGQSFDVAADTNVEELIDIVNAHQNTTGVTMAYDERMGTFSIINNNGGSNTDEALAAIEIIDEHGVIFGDKGLTRIEAGNIESTANVRRSDTIAQALQKMGKDPSGVDAIDGDTLTVEVNDKVFTFNILKDKLSDIMTKINSSTEGVEFNFSEMSDTFSIASTKTGRNSEFSFSGFDVFGLAEGQAGYTFAEGEDAVVTLTDGRELRQSSNNFTLDGLTFNVTGDYNLSGTEAALGVEINRDYSATVDNVKNLVKAYNELVTKLNTYYTEELDRDYEPLTKSEEDEITEKQAEEITAKAKSGILRNDPTIGRLLTNIRSAITVKVGETGMSLQDIGISTVAWDSAEWKTNQGTLQLDEEKLRAALEKDPNAVQNVLAAAGDTTVTGSGLSATSEAGFLTRINAFMQSFNTTMRSSTIKTAAEEVTKSAEKTDDLEMKLFELEESYWRKFSVLETMMSQLNSQQGYLTSMLSSLNNNNK